MNVKGALEIIKQEEQSNIIPFQKPPEEVRKLTTFVNWEKTVREYLDKFNNDRLKSLIEKGATEEGAKKEIDKPLSHTMVVLIARKG